MRLKNIPGALEEAQKSPYVFTEPEPYRGRWQSVFPAEAPLEAELGMGKGRFLTGMAEAHPGINYLGVEKYASVLVKAVKKQEEKKLPNLRLLLMDAKDLLSVFGEGEIDRIYLNFPDPWPKKRHAKRRLTSPGYLACYEKVLKRSGRLELKTDNRELFAYSLASMEERGWILTSVTEDLYADGVPETSVRTEYEEKFAARGTPICRLTAQRPAAGDGARQKGVDEAGEAVIE